MRWIGLAGFELWRSRSPYKPDRRIAAMVPSGEAARDFQVDQKA
jgi:hypothetical protein